MLDRVLLFLDVDGTLIPFGGSQPHTEHLPRFAGADPSAHPLLPRVNPDLGPLLAGLGCEIVWATTWTAADANSGLCPWLGWTPLPAVHWPEDEDPPGPPHWKLRPLLAWAGDRPFVWIDDEITEPDRIWVAGHYEGRALLHRVDHRRGLRSEDIDAIRTWIAGA